MNMLNTLLDACQVEQADLLTATRERVAQWDNWLKPLSGLETLAFSDGTPFADEVTLNRIQQSVLDTVGGWGKDTPSAPVNRSHQ